MRRILYVGALVVAVGVGALARKNASAAPPLPVASSAGRWQVVNGTPDMARNIMLLDSVTGQTWIACTGEAGNSWCYMPRTDHRTTGGERSVE